MQAKRFPLIALGFAGIILLEAFSVAWGVYDMLNEQSGMSGAGWPYAVCFFIAGCVAAAVVLYSAVLVHRGSSLLALVPAVKMGLIVCLLAAIVCSLWFIIATGLFNIVGVLGLLFSILATSWGVGLANRILGRVKKQQTSKVQ